jgi:signal transduction histidine kinase
MPDYRQGIKKEVAEVKFLIHDLRVEGFVNEVIHFHVTLNTDLEIYNIEQAQILHSEDLQVLKTKAVSLRKALQDYSNAVRSFSPDRTVLLTGKRYIDTIYGTCELILNPLWGRIDKVLGFLPAESRSVRSRPQYQNCINWLGGVYNRIKHFRDEQEGKDKYEEFDLGKELENFSRDVVYGYVTEKSRDRVKLRLDQLDSAIIAGNRVRFRRMYFNLIMNSVDALTGTDDGVITVSNIIEGDHVVLRVHDNGLGMTSEKAAELLTDRDTLDGELHSLGFIFVRQTIAEFKGELSIQSEIGSGTTMTISLPFLTAHKGLSQPEEPSAKQLPATDDSPAKPVPAVDDKYNNCGRIVYEDYKNSEAQFPGSIFAMSVTDENVVDFFPHKPYERYWNITHEDLMPMLFESTVRGRLEEDDQKVPFVILKAPGDVSQYFDFKEVPEQERSPQKHLQMLRDEYIRIARKLMETGLPPGMAASVTDLDKCFPGQDELLKDDPFPLELLANQPLTTEKDE